jgi:hypothetical protein
MHQGGQIMPGYNQKGPLGEGKMTGRQRGMCRRTEDQSFQDIRGGRGRGLGLGRGTGGMQDVVRQSGTKEKTDSNPEDVFYDNLKSLKEQYRDTQTMLSTIEKKIKALESRL